MQDIPNDSAKIWTHELFTLAYVEMIENILLDQIKIRKAEVLARS
jgi:hypothetical protein